MRYVVAIVFLLVVLGGLGALKAGQIATLVASGKTAARQGPPPEVIGTAIAKEDVWEATLSDVGTVASAKGVTLSNESPGLVTAIRFESGHSVKRGDVLVELDTNVERAQLASAVARKKLSGTTWDRTRSLVATGSLPAQQGDTDRTALEAADKDVEAIQGQISRKIVRASFDGRLGIRQVNLGQYLTAGTPVVVLESVKTIFVDFTMPQERLGELAVGMPVNLSLGVDAGSARTGAIAAIEPAIDTASRTVRVRATVPNDDEAIRPGMFVRVTVVLPRLDRLVIVPATAIVHASFGDSVFVVEQRPPAASGMSTTPDGKPVKIARQAFVRTGEARGDFIAVLEGAIPGQEVVTSGAFKLRNGAPVVVDNSVQPKPELHPRPENR